MPFISIITPQAITKLTKQYKKDKNALYLHLNNIFFNYQTSKLKKLKVTNDVIHVLWAPKLDNLYR